MRWLSGGTASDLLNPIASELLDIRPVGTAVNKVGNEGEGLWGRA
jgi:putative SOS response-associated peptidase YedK